MFTVYRHSTCKGLLCDAITVRFFFFLMWHCVGQSGILELLARGVARVIKHLCWNCIREDLGKKRRAVGRVDTINTIYRSWYNQKKKKDLTDNYEPMSLSRMKELVKLNVKKEWARGLNIKNEEASGQIVRNEGGSWLNVNNEGDSELNVNNEGASGLSVKNEGTSG